MGSGKTDGVVGNYYVGRRSEPNEIKIAELNSFPASVSRGESVSIGTIHRENVEHARTLTEVDLKNLDAVMGHEIAENTRKSYRSQWRRFSDWARNRDIETLPAAPAQVSAYLAERAEQYGHRPATLRASAAAISHTHRIEGLADPCASEEVKNTLKSATRLLGSFQRQARGLTADTLEEIRATACLPRRGRGGRMEGLDTAVRRGRMDIAMASLMRDALLRVSEAAELRWKDIVEEDDGTGRLLIRRSKTDAEGEGAIAFVSVTTMGNLKAIRGAATDDRSIFGLCRHQISRRIKQAAQAAGLGDGFSGHSPRVGMARDLARAGTELPRLMTAGRWRSPRMPALYTRNESVARGAVAQYYGSADAGSKRGIGGTARGPSPKRVSREFAPARLTDAPDSLSEFKEDLAARVQRVEPMRGFANHVGNIVGLPPNIVGVSVPHTGKCSITAIMGRFSWRDSKTADKRLYFEYLPLLLRSLARPMPAASPCASILNRRLCSLHPA